MSSTCIFFGPQLDKITGFCSQEVEQTATPSNLIILCKLLLLFKSRVVFNPIFCNCRNCFSG